MPAISSTHVVGPLSLHTSGESRLLCHKAWVGGSYASSVGVLFLTWSAAKTSLTLTLKPCVLYRKDLACYVTVKGTVV